jgi:hypothetical protein
MPVATRQAEFASPPTHSQTKARRKLVTAFTASLDSHFMAEKEVPFQPLPEHEAWIADVAVMSTARWESTPENGYFEGVPEIVITASEMLDREQICLSNGGSEFWLLDSDRKTVKVTTADGRARSYGPGDIIPMTGFGQPIAVAQLF